MSLPKPGFKSSRFSSVLVVTLYDSDTVFSSLNTSNNLVHFLQFSSGRHHSKQAARSYQLTMSLKLPVGPCKNRSIVYPLLLSTKIIGFNPRRMIVDSSCTVSCLGKPSAGHSVKRIRALTNFRHPQKGTSYPFGTVLRPEPRQGRRQRNTQCFPTTFESCRPSQTS